MNRMTRRGFHQREHRRTNRKGTTFAAGRTKAMYGHVTNLVDFDPTLFNDIPPGFDAPLHFSLGYNKKIHSSIPIWNLPTIRTCPSRTPACSKFCYAIPAEKLGGSTTLHSRERNWKYSLRQDFVTRANTYLKIINPDYVRIHESGDFYNEEYFKKWLRIVALNPKIRFLAFTKTFSWDYLKYVIPGNLQLIFSIDDTSRPEFLTLARNPRIPRFKAYVGSSNRFGYGICPKNDDPHAGCTPFPGLDVNHKGAGRVKKEAVVFSRPCMACWYGQNVFFVER